MSELQDTAAHLVIVGRGRVIADTSTAALLAAASGDRVIVHSSARDTAIQVLNQAGAQAAATADDSFVVTGLSAERVVALLTGGGVPFSEVTAHRASLEQAYLDLTGNAVEYRSGHAEATR
jgi:ABC-2 type transport system ATP-binding protein